MAGPVVATLAELRETWPDLREVSVIGLDLRHEARHDDASREPSRRRGERAVVDAVECAVLANRVDERFDGIVIDRNKRGVVVQLRSPAVVAPMDSDVGLGESVPVTLVAVDQITRRVELALFGDH